MQYYAMAAQNTLVTQFWCKNELYLDSFRLLFSLWVCFLLDKGGAKLHRFSYSTSHFLKVLCMFSHENNSCLVLWLLQYFLLTRLFSFQQVTYCTFEKYPNFIVWENSLSDRFQSPLKSCFVIDHQQHLSFTINVS